MRLLSACSALRNQRFTESSLVAGYDRTGDAQDRFVRPVVPHQPDNLCVRKLAVKGKDILHLGAAEPVDGLVIIADNTYVGILTGQFPQQPELRIV